MGDINSYVLVEELGRGLSGIVYKAKGLVKSKNTQVAIKVVELTADEDKDYRLREEIRIIKKCAHINIARYLESFDDHGKTFIVMELCDTTLYKYLMERTFLEQSEATYFIHQLLCALDYLHNKLKIVHRDIKLGNVLLQYNSGTGLPVVKLGDFGLAASLGDHPDNEQLTYCGTPNYMAPEVAQNKSQSYPRDMWSVGVLFYYLVTGSAPFAQDTKEETIRAAVRGKYAYDDRISEEGHDFLMGLLQVNPEDRLTAKQALQHSIIKRIRLSMQLPHQMESSSLSGSVSFVSNAGTSYSTPSRRDRGAHVQKNQQLQQFQQSQRGYNTHKKSSSGSSSGLGSPNSPSASSNVATPVASYNSVPRQGSQYITHQLNSHETSSYSHGSRAAAAGGRTENLYANNGRRSQSEWLQLPNPSSLRSSGSSTGSGSGSGSGGSRGRTNKGNRISIDQLNLKMHFSEELVLDEEVVGQKESVEEQQEEHSLNSYEKTAALLGFSNEDTLNSRSELSSSGVGVNVARRLNYLDSDTLRGPKYGLDPATISNYGGKHQGGASRRYQTNEVSEYDSFNDEDYHEEKEDRSVLPSVVTGHTTLTATTVTPVLVIQRGGRTQYLDSRGTTFYDDSAAAVGLIESDVTSASNFHSRYVDAAFDLKGEFEQPLPVIHNDEEEEDLNEATAVAVETVPSVEPIEESVVAAIEPSEQQLQEYSYLLSVAETIQAKRFLLQPLVFATTAQELLMISSPLPTGKVVDVGGCVGDLLYCVPLPATAAADQEGSILGVFITAAFHELDGTNETIVCQKILSEEEVRLWKELYSMQDNSNEVVAQDPDPMVNSLYFQNRIVDCDWKSRYNGLNCPLLDGEMWLQHKVTPASLIETDGLQKSLDRLCSLVDAIGAVVNRIIVKFRPDAEQVTSATRRLERIKAEFSLMSNDDVRPMFRMRWTNGMYLAANLATNKLSFLRTRRPLLADGVTRSTEEVDTEEWTGLCSLHHCDYPDLLPAGLPEELPDRLVKYVMMAISAVGMCLHEVRAKECAVKDCELLNGNVRLLVCTKFDEIY